MALDAPPPAEPEEDSDAMGEDGSDSASTTSGGADEDGDGASGRGAGDGVGDHAARRARTLHAAAQMGLGPAAPPAEARAARAAAAQHEVMALASLVQRVASSIGPVPQGGRIPWPVRQQKWSKCFVPLFWAAAGNGEMPPAVRWLASAAGTVGDYVELGEERLECAQAVHTGWLAIRGALRRLGVGSAADLCDFCAREGFHGVQGVTSRRVCRHAY